MGKIVNDISDSLGRELDSGEVLDIFRNHFLNIKSPLELVRYGSSMAEGSEKVDIKATIVWNGEEAQIAGEGNGPLSAFVDAMRKGGHNDFDIADFHEQSLGEGSTTEAVAYVAIKKGGDRVYWGAGKHTDITTAGILALIGAYNVSMKSAGSKS